MQTEVGDGNFVSEPEHKNNFLKVDETKKEKFDILANESFLLVMRNGNVESAIKF